MTRLNTISLVAALLIGASPLAFAQAVTPLVAPAQTGAHPETAATGPGMQRASAMTDQEITAKLTAAGFTSISGIRGDAKGYSARATKDGKAVEVDMDANGAVLLAQ
jgi:hypothetical protein